MNCSLLDVAYQGDATSLAQRDGAVFCQQMAAVIQTPSADKLALLQRRLRLEE